MTHLFSYSRVRELQAMLFPVQPIPGVTLTGMHGSPETQVPQLERVKVTEQSMESTLVSLPLSVTMHQRSKEALRALQSVQCLVESISQEAARWPTECQVMAERVRHINYHPAVPEPFYMLTGKEPRPKPIGDEFGTIVYRYCPMNITNYFSRSCVGGSAILPFPNKCLSESDNYAISTSKSEGNDTILFVTEISKSTDSSNDLQFESRFESGNLSKVVKITDTYYQLYLRRDLYTQRHTQWYYFQISNTKSKITYRLSIVNMCKEESLYNEGLKPLLYSTEDARTKSIGWRRCGENITYFKNNDSLDEEKEKHTLTFNVSFPHDKDTVYLAHCYPYTYTDLQEYLANIVSDPAKARFTKLRLLCRTLAGNNVYYLTITAPTYHEDVRRKRGVIITARVHPGETPSSWMMKGIIDFLTSESNQAKELRERFVFKLVPMLNPDGVIVGNNRCSLSGKDLNRQYRTVMRESYPSVWHTKLMIRRLLEECGVAIYCDLHAHSRKHNIFAYGCESKRSGCNGKLSEQVFPLMLHKNAADKFSFENCKFHIEKGKEGTGRVVVWSMGVQNSYTMEASMGGSRMGSRAGTHFSIQDYEQIGKAFCETLLDFSDQDPTKERLRTKIIARLMKEGSSAEEPTNIDLTDYSSDEGDTSESSTSEESNTPFPNDFWNYEEKKNSKQRNFLCAPPPSPTFVRAGSIKLTKRRMIRRNKALERSYVERRKLLTHRAVMDLHTTEPGSDLCYMTDSIDEYFSKSGARLREIENRRKDKINTNLSERKAKIMKRRECSSSIDCPILPAIIRQRSVSLGEDLLNERNQHRQKTVERTRCLFLSRALKHPCQMSITSRDVQIKMTSLRQRIWTGVQTDDEKDGSRNVEDLLNIPLSWGVSRLATTNYPVNAEVLLRSCSEKLRSLDCNPMTKKGKKRSRRRERERNERPTEEEEEEEGEGEEEEEEKAQERKEEKKETQESIPEESRSEQTTRNGERRRKCGAKKKRSRSKWRETTVNLNSRPKDARNENAAILSALQADSLKLITIAPAKSGTKQHRHETSRSKFHNDEEAFFEPDRNVTKSHAQRRQLRLRSLVPRVCNGFSTNDDDDAENQKEQKEKEKEEEEGGNNQEEDSENNDEEDDEENDEAEDDDEVGGNEESCKSKGTTKKKKKIKNKKQQQQQQQRKKKQHQKKTTILEAVVVRKGTRKRYAV